jgi:hypothetical protein
MGGASFHAARGLKLFLKSLEFASAGLSLTHARCTSRRQARKTRRSADG